MAETKLNSQINTLAELNGNTDKQIISSLSKINNDTVHKTENESISGVKTFTETINGNISSANKVKNNFVIKVKSGAYEGTSLYTYNGSAAKTLDIKQGTNVTLTAAAGSLTIAASDTHYTTHLYAGNSGYASKASTSNGNTTLVLADNSNVRENVKLIGTNGISVTSDANNIITISNSGGSSGSSGANVEAYPISKRTVNYFFNSRKPIDKVFNNVYVKIKLLNTVGDSDGEVVNELVDYENSEALTLHSNVDYELTDLTEQYDLAEILDNNYISAIAIELQGTEIDEKENEFEYFYSTVGNDIEGCENSFYNSWTYALRTVNEDKLETTEYWNTIDFNSYTNASLSSNISRDLEHNKEATVYLNFASGYKYDEIVTINDISGSVFRLEDDLQFSLTIKIDDEGKYHFILNYTCIESENG